MCRAAELWSGNCQPAVVLYVIIIGLLCIIATVNNASIALAETSDAKGFIYNQLLVCYAGPAISNPGYATIN